MSKTGGVGCRVPVAVPYPYPYPYMMAGHYACDCCQNMYQPTVDQTAIPASGMVKANLFTVANSVPYIIDNTVFEFGTKTSVSENVNTKVIRQKDCSCINLSGTFDLTEELITNTSLYSFLQQTIGGQFDTLEHVLPVIRPIFTFKIYYQILDSMGGLVDESHIISNIQTGKFHYTDVKDYFIQTFHNVMVKNVGPFDYTGIYTLKLTRAELYVSYVDTKNHTVDDFNPYYQFTDNNTKIVVQHDAVMDIDPDGTVLLAGTDLNYATEFEANVTTRLKISYTTFLSKMIITTDTFGVYRALFTPTEALIETLRNAILSMSDTITNLTARVEELERSIPHTVEKYQKAHTFDAGTITYLNYGELYQVTTSYTTSADPDTELAVLFAADIDSGKLVPVVTPQSN